MKPATINQIKSQLPNLSVDLYITQYIELYPQDEKKIFKQYFGKLLVPLTQRLVTELTNKSFLSISTSDIKPIVEKIDQIHHIVLNNKSIDNRKYSFTWYETVDTYSRICNKCDIPYRIFTHRVRKTKKFNVSTTYIFLSPIHEFDTWKLPLVKKQIKISDIEKLQVNQYIKLFTMDIISPRSIARKITNNESLIAIDTPMKPEQLFNRGNFYYLTRVNKHSITMKGLKFNSLTLMNRYIEAKDKKLFMEKHRENEINKFAEGKLDNFIQNKFTSNRLNNLSPIKYQAEDLVEEYSEFEFELVTDNYGNGIRLTNTNYYFVPKNSLLGLYHKMFRVDDLIKMPVVFISEFGDADEDKIYFESQF